MEAALLPDHQVQLRLQQQEHLEEGGQAHPLSTADCSQTLALTEC